MKYILLTLTVFLSIIQKVSPQSPYADSLLRVVAQLPDNREKADNFILLARHYRTSDSESAWNYCDKAYNLAVGLNYPEAYAEAIYLKGLMLKGQDKYNEAKALNERYLQIADSLNDEKRLAKGFYNQGNLYKDLLDFEHAINYFGKSLHLYLSLQDTLGILANYNAIGDFYLSQARYDSASVYFHKSLDICEKSGNIENLGSLLYNLSTVYLELGQYETALKYATRNIEMNLENNRMDKLAKGYTMAGRIYSGLGKMNEALDYYEKAMELVIRLKDTVSISNLENNIGVLYRDQGEYSHALEYYDRALKGYILKDYTRGIIVVYGNKGALLSILDRHDEAIALQEKVLEMSEKYNLQDYRKDALENLSYSWMKLGNYRKAYDYHIRYTELNDSIFNIEKTKLINDLTLKYEKEKDQAQILELEKTNLEKDLSLRKRTNQRNGYFFTGIGVFLVALFLSLYLRQKARKDKIIAQQKIRQLEEEKKLMAAKLLVEGQEEERKRIARELHDGIGVLLSATKMQFTSIKDTSPENKPLIERATQLLEQATGDVRKISHNMMPGLLTKLGLYEAVEDLFENLSESGKISAICEIEEDLERLPENQEIMLYRIIQEMVNNSLKYADAATLRLLIRKMGNLLEIHYSDDGKGFDLKQKLASESSIGLKSIQSRVDFLNGKVVIETGPDKGTSYSIEVPA